MGFAEVLIPHRMRTYSASLSYIGAGLRPAREMGRLISKPWLARRLTARRTSHIYNAGLCDAPLASPYLAARQRLRRLGGRVGRIRGAKNIAPPQMRIRNHSRFIFAADI